MNNILLLVIISAFSNFICAQNAVVVLDQTIYEIYNKNNSDQTRIIEINLLNENGLKFVKFGIWENKFYELEEFNYTVFDQTIKKLMNMMKVISKKQI